MLVVTKQRRLKPFGAPTGQRLPDFVLRRNQRGRLFGAVA